MKDWTASRWADWASGFLPPGVILKSKPRGIPRWRVDGESEEFNPLHDANHLMLVKAEIRRKGWRWGLIAMEGSIYCYVEEFQEGGLCTGSPEVDTENLAVLLAAKALEATA